MNGLDLRSPLRGIDVCAGSGIGSAAFWACGFATTVCYVERDEFCQQLLQARMRSGDLLPAPIWDDLRTFDGRPWRGRVDIIFGGIPCQPYSVAGQQRGDTDERDLWPAFRRVLGEVRPRVALLENVFGFASLRGGLDRVLRDLAEDGWSAEWSVISAADLGANHLRKRVWLVAYAGSDGWEGTEREGEWEGMPSLRRRPADEGIADVADAEEQPLGAGLCAGGPGRQWWRRPCDGGGAGDAANAGCPHGTPRGAVIQRGEASREDRQTGGVAGPCSDPGGEGRRAQPDLGLLADGLAAALAGVRCADWWAQEPDVRRLSAGVERRVAKLRCLGNGWVPHVAAYVAGRIQAWLDEQDTQESEVTP